MASISARSVFITGANRGIGLEFVKQLIGLPQPPKHVFATCRNADSAKELNELAAGHPSIHVHKFDAVDYGSYPSIVQWVEKIVGEEGLNVLISNAGQYTRNDLASVTPEAMRSDYELNTIAPLMLAKAFQPLLKKAASASKIPSLNCSKAAVINISSKMGSIDDNTSSGAYSYRSSKAAQNMVSKGLSIDLRPDEIMVLALHPGWVVTDMGGKNALVDTKTSVAGLLKVMSEQNEADSGKLITYQGIAVPW